MSFFVGLGYESYDRQYSDRELARRLAGYFRPHAWRLAGAALLVAAASVLAAGTPVLFARMVNAMAQQMDWAEVYFLAGLMTLLGLGVWLVNWGRRHLLGTVIADVTYAMAADAIRAVLGHDMAFFDRHASGRVASRIVNDTKEIGQVVTLLADFVAQMLHVAVLAVYLVAIEWRLGLTAITLMPVLFLLAWAFRRWARRVTFAGMRALATVNSTIKETLAGIATAKVFRQEAAIYAEFEQANRQSYRVNLVRGWSLAIVFPVLSVVSGFGSALLLYLGGRGVLHGAITAGDWMLFLLSLERFWFPMASLSAFWSQVQGGLAAAERVFALMDVPRQVRQVAQNPVPRLQGDIRFQQVTFAYEPGRPVLRDFSLHIRPRETVALVGHTGAGKSSIARLVARLYEFQGGRILVDGHDIRTFDLAQYRRQLGYVPQRPFLFAGTVLDNIRYARPQATEDEILALARQIGGGAWLDALPHGLHTQVGERGSGLSMGQRQLVALLRILLQKPAIFILDEATASIDPFTERQIQEALELILARSTSILIAHRLFTVQRADRILVLDHGRIIEEGDHATLLARGGHYAHLYNTYFRHQSLDYVEAARRFLEP